MSKKAQVGMPGNSLSLNAWSNAAFYTQVAAWAFGFLALCCTITAYYAKSRVTILKEQHAKSREEAEKRQRGPRSLSGEQAQSIGVAAKTAGLSILLIVVNDAEARSYAIEIGHALEHSGVPLKGMPIGFTPTPGLAVWGEEQAAQKLITILTNAGIPAAYSGMPMLPMPASAAKDYVGFIGLMVGTKPTL